MPYSTIVKPKNVSKLFLRDQNNMYENRQMGTLLGTAATAVYPIGTLLARAKDSADAGFKVAANEDLVATNELAVLGGDRESIWNDVNHTTGTASPIVYFSDRLSLDETEFFLINSAITDKAKVIAKLQSQQIVFHKRAPSYTPV